MPSLMLLAGIYVPFARAMLVLPYTEQLSDCDIVDALALGPDELDAPLVETVVDVELVEVVVLQTKNGDSPAPTDGPVIVPQLDTLPLVLVV